MYILEEKAYNSGRGVVACISAMLDITYILSKLVVPVLAYNRTDPSRIKQEDSPPNKKYVSPLAVADSESLCKVESMYRP